MHYDTVSTDSWTENRTTRKSPAAVIRAMQQLAGTPFAVRHALALLPYHDREEAQRRRVEMFGFEAGSIERDASGAVVHASVLACTGFVRLHPVMPDVAPPGRGVRFGLRQQQT